MKKKLIFRWLLPLFFLVGCATTQDLRSLQFEAQHRADTLEQKIITSEQQITINKKEIDADRGAIATIQKNQAEMGADLADLRDHVQQLRGAIESLRKDLVTVTNRATRKEDDTKDIREKIEQLHVKVSFMENFLGLGKREGETESSDKTGKQSSLSKEAKIKPDKEILYATAYDLFKEGKYEKARLEFQNYLKQFPETEYADNAQFWIGECFYFENKFEKAILEYEKVIKNYPDGDKISYALLKQGLSFQKLGDKSSAKLLLQQVMKDYPNTNQAKIARSKLMELQ